MNIDSTSDFYLLDNLEPLTLQVSGQPDAAIAVALAEPAQWKEGDPAAGNVLEGDRLWIWPIVATPIRPPLGSVLVDGGGDRWSILAIERKEHVNTWEARTRNLAVVNGLDNVATVLKASYTKSPGGEALPTWATQLTNVPARFQPVEQDARILEDAEWPRTTYHVILGLDIFAPAIPVEPASTDYRLVDTAGRHYRIVKYERPERIDRLPVAVCVLVLEGAEGGAVNRVSSSSGA